MADLQGLLGFTPDDLQQAMALLGPQQADKDMATKNALMAMGLGMMGARRGQELGAFGNAGLMGMQNYQNTLQNQVKQRQEALPQLVAMRTMAMQNAAMKQAADILGGAGQPQTVPGPNASFQQPGGAAALMNGAMGGQAPAPAQLPTQVPMPPSPDGIREALAKANYVQTMAGLPDRSAAIKGMFPDPISGRPGGYLYDPMSKKMIYLPKIPDGADVQIQPDGSKLITMIPGATGARAADAAATAAGTASMKLPTPVVGPGGQTGLPSGSLLDQITRGGPLPFGLPSPYGPQPSQGAPAQPGQAGQAVPPSTLPGFTQTKLSPEQQKRSEGLGDFQNTLDQRAHAAQTAIARLDTIDQLADTIHPGQFNTVRQMLGRTFTDLGFNKDSVDKWLGSVAGNQIFGKNASQIAIDQTAGTGQSAWGALRDIAAANPNATMDPQAIHAIVGEMRAILQRNGPDMQTAAKAWLADPSHNGSYEGFEENYNRTQPMTSKMPPPNNAVPAQIKPTAAGAGNSTVAYILAHNPTPAQIAKLRAKGFVQ